VARRGGDAGPVSARGPMRGARYADVVQRSPAEVPAVAPGTVADTLAFLLGTWTLERSIVDHRSGTAGTFEGTAVLSAPPMAGHAACGPRARYDERGALQFGTHTGAARRVFDYVRRNGAEVMIYFADGRPFVDLDLTRSIWRSSHRCGEDLHEIVTVVRSEVVIEERWRVRGPTTNYDATSLLIRVHETASTAVKKSE
jgi:hypothetical protein